MKKSDNSIPFKNPLSLQKGELSEKSKDVPMDQESADSVSSPLVVGIGASAGGLESFKTFFSSMPPDSGMAFVVVQHLDPRHESLMAMLLIHYTAMQVISIKDKMWVEPNHVYVLPPNKFLKITGGIFYLGQSPETLGARTVIDLFFSSLADDKKDKAIGIIFSGAGSDGSVGCKNIKDKGGLVIVQDPTTAAFGSMPQSVITSGSMTYVLPPEKIPEILIKHMKEFLEGTKDNNVKSEENGRMDFDLILSLLKKITRDDFYSYKKPTLMRRLHKRMEANNIESLSDYCQFLESTPSEISLLHADFLIKTTSFFRNPKSFEVLAQKIFPRIISEPDEPFRVWVPGCSTGEEAYSIAIILMEQFSIANINKKIQIFATDIDGEAINFARRGIYPTKIEPHISEERLKRFFDKDEAKYQVKREVRENVLFVLHNVLRDSPFSKLDLISCRNVFIYLEPEVQKEIIKSFHFALQEGGYLFLGSAETINKEWGCFETVSKKDSIFKRLEVTSRNTITAPLLYKESLSHDLPLRVPLTLPKKSLFDRVKQQLMEEYLPATLVVNAKFEVLYFFGAINQYLKINEGVPNLNLFSMTRRDLAGKIIKAIQEILQDKEKRTIISVYMENNHNKEYYCVDIKISIVKNINEHGIFTVTFQEREKKLSAQESKKKSVSAQERENFEHELSDVRAYLQSTIEDLQAANEGLKIFNEELMSANEELQAAGEEMETSKEELQSLNEELTVVNAQFQEKIEEQERTNNDLTNLFRSTDIATIFLDHKLCLKRFTPESLKIFNFIDSDIGRPIKDITMRFSDAALMRDVQDILERDQDILEKDVPIERELQTEKNEWYLRKCNAYKTTEGKITGVVITFSNVTKLKNAQKLAQENERKLLKIFDALPIKIAYIDHTLNYRFSNKLHAEWVGLPAKELLDHSLKTLALPHPYETIEPYIIQALTTSQITKFDTKVITSSGDFQYEEIILIPEMDDNKNVKGFFMLMFDITDRQRDILTQLELSHSFLKAIINAVPDPVCVKDENYRLIVANKSFCEKFRKTEKELLGCTTEQLYPKWKANSVIEENKEGFTKGIFQGKKRGLFSEENKIYIVKKVLFQTQNHEKYLVCSYQNVTELHNSKEKLKKIVQKLKISNEDLKNFAYVCSHDLQEPARTVSCFAQLFFEHFNNLVDEEGKKYLYFILDGSKRMIKMINEALTYAKVTKQADITDSVDCEALLTKVLENLNASIEEHKAVITHDSLPVIEGDPIKFSQIFQNLISNAIKFNNKQKIIIHVGVNLSKSGYTFSVKDNGIGINMDHKGRLFDLFYRLNKREDYPGTGLGLAICKKIIGSYGGKIWVESEPDKGATFYFSIPHKKMVPNYNEKTIKI